MDSGTVDDEEGGVVVLVGLEEYGLLWRRAYGSEFAAADVDSACTRGLELEAKG